jgi:glycine/D-amino acid oxidase-like deaminating enzyme
VGGALSGNRPLWVDTAPPATPRRPLAGDAEADVVIVGGGFTGLWTAYYLTEADPALRISVVEAETVGYGASGRNGGWCSALFPASYDKLARLAGAPAARAQHAAMQASVIEVGRAAAANGTDIDYARGGSVTLIRSPAQLARARVEVADARRQGRGPDDLSLLPEPEARAILDGTDTLGATYTPHCAVLQPLRLVHGLAASLVARGVRIHEHTRATHLLPGRVVTPSGTISTGTVVRATEGYTPGLPGHRRTVIPVYSLVIATEPLPEATWARIGLARRETFSDHRHLVVYGQRTRDDRLVFGGRGAPYHLGSRVAARFDRNDRVFAALHATLVRMLPVLSDARFTHAWGGPLGVPRDWCATVGLDPVTRLGWAGGYVGDGVATSNLAGRTLRDLVLGRRTELTALPWVGHRSPPWEPEPMRWLAVNAALRATMVADAAERVTGRPSLAARAVAPFLG